MEFFLILDEELAGGHDDSGCFHRPEAVNEVLTEYGITDFEARRIARKLLRCIGRGRSAGHYADDDDEDEEG